jgi:hypothetical protein
VVSRVREKTAQKFQVPIMTKSDEIARELEKFYCHDAEVFNRDGGLLSVTNDVRSRPTI